MGNWVERKPECGILVPQVAIEFVSTGALASPETSEEEASILRLRDTFK